MCVYVCVCVHALMRMGRECKHELARSLLGVGDDGVKGLCRGADVDEDAALRPGVHLARPVDVHARERVLGALGERARRVLRRAALLAEQAAVVAAAAHRARDRRRRRHRVVGVEHACRVVLVVHQALHIVLEVRACAEGCGGGWEQTIAEYSRSFSSALGMLLSLFPGPWGSVPLGRGVTLLIVVVIPGACFTKHKWLLFWLKKERTKCAALKCAALDAAVARAQNGAGTRPRTRALPAGAVSVLSTPCLFRRAWMEVLFVTVTSATSQKRLGSSSW